MLRKIIRNGAPAFVAVAVLGAAYLVPNATGALNLNSRPVYCGYSGGTPCTQPSNPQPWVRQVYQDVLNRQPDDAALLYYSNRLAAGVPGYQVAQEIVYSQERNTNLVKGWYLQYLKRPADTGGLGYFTNLLNNRQSDETVQAYIIGSDEYYVKAGGTNASFVNQVYLDVLGRAADAGGAAYWTGLLNNGASRVTVAYYILGSDEARSNLVIGYYQHYLRRNPDQTALNNAVAALRNGLADEDLIAQILSSAEYYAHATT